jgi:hypothetical protein
LELISAYIDDELNAADRRLVEDHIEACVDCSALHDTYREISTAAKETLAPAPERLCSAVMADILRESDAAVQKRAKTLAVVRVILSRYLPLAACLAFVILTLPLLIRLGFSSGSADNAATMSETSMTEGVLTGGGDQVEAWEPGPSMSGAPSAKSRNESPATVAPQLPEESESFLYTGDYEAASTADEPESGYGNKAANDNVSRPVPSETGDGDIAPSDAEPSTAEPSAPAAGNEHDSNYGDAGVSAPTAELRDSNDSAAENPSPGGDMHGAVNEDSPGTSYSGESSAYIQPPPQPEAPPMQTPASLLPPSSVQTNYFAVITIAGALPDMLSEFEQVAVSGAERHIFIPRDTALELIDSKAAGMEIEYGDETSDVAMIIIY